MKLIQAEGTLIISSFCKNQRETVVIRLSKYLGNIKEKYFQIHFPLATACLSDEYSCVCSTSGAIIFPALLFQECT